MQLQILTNVDFWETAIIKILSPLVCGCFQKLGCTHALKWIYNFSTVILASDLDSPRSCLYCLSPLPHPNWNMSNQIWFSILFCLEVGYSNASTPVSRSTVTFCQVLQTIPWRKWYVKQKNLGNNLPDSIWIAEWKH